MREPLARAIAASCAANRDWQQLIFWDAATMLR
jgi:hypothetical protein